jgi:hypothetical protein
VGADGALPAGLIARMDSVEHRLRDELAEHREEQAKRNEHLSERLNDIAIELAEINTGIKIGKIIGGAFFGLLATVGAGVLHLVLR